MRASTELAGLVVLALVACGGDNDGNAQPTERPADSSVVTLCEEPLPVAGEYEGLSDTASTTGTYLHPYTVVVPESIDPTVPAPKVNLACDGADRVASYSSGLGATAPRDGCDPDRPVPLLSFTGDMDRYGDSALVAAWAELNGCDLEPATDELGSGVSHIRYEGCDAAVEFFDIKGMGHV